MYRHFCLLISLLAVSVGCYGGGWYGNNQPAYPVGSYPQPGYSANNYQNNGYPVGANSFGNQPPPTYATNPGLQPSLQPGFGQPVNGQMPVGQPNYSQPLPGGFPQGGGYPNGGYPAGYYPQNQGVPLNSMYPSQPIFGR